MVVFHPIDPLVTGLSFDMLEAQREVNDLLIQFPQPDVTTPEGLAQLRGLTSPPQSVPVLTPLNITIAGPGGDLRLRILSPPGQAKAVIVRIHGGGWAAGSPEDDEALNDEIARRCQVAIVSPDYRLVPESTIGDQIADCVATVRWVLTEAPVRFGTDRLLLAGISAGAHLAAATLLGLRDSNELALARIVGVHLDCGAYDLSGTPSVRSSTHEALVLSRGLIEGLIALGLPGMDAEARRDPSLSPLFAELFGLPPALFTVGNLDPLRDDSVFMAARWRLGANAADLDVWPDGAHAFTNMGTPLATVALDRTIRWITARLDESGLVG